MSKFDLTDHAARALPKESLDRFEVIEGDEARARAGSDAAFQLKSAALPDWQHAKSVKTQHENDAFILGLQPDPETSARSSRAVDKAKARMDDATKRGAESNRALGSIRKVLESATSYVETEVVAFNRGRTVEPQRENLGIMGEALTWLKPEPESPFKPIKGPALPRGKRMDDLVEETRAEIGKHRDNIKRVGGAWPAQGALVKSAMVPIAELAKRPRVEVAFSKSGISVRLPSVKIDAASSSGFAVPVAPDFRPAYVREHFVEIEAEVTQKVAAYYAENDILVLSEAERRARVAKLDAEILALERLECEAIFATRKHGQHLDFRPDTDPRALLGIDGPTPKKRR